jgi:tRNA U34 5-carboxymethylaminomethyl modifying GTPase MnmE/TrmE
VIASADIVLYVIDGTVGFSEGEEERIAGYRATRPCILAVNKADLCACEEPGPRHARKVRGRRDGPACPRTIYHLPPSASAP